MTWYESFKKTLSEDTFKNPLDTLFPDLRKKATGQDAPKLEKETSLTTKIKTTAKDTLAKISNFGKDLSFFAVVVLAGVVFYFFRKK